MLEAANKRLREFQDGIPHLAWTARVDGSKDYVNERWREFTGRTTEELLGWNWLNLVHPDDRVRHEKDWRKAMEVGERYQEQLRLIRHDGVYRWHAMRDWPTRDQDGNITHWFGTATDIDDQRQLEDSLRTAKEMAEEANQAKSIFLATMSHEIRTPMNGIIGMINLLMGTSLTDDQRVFAADARSSSEHLMVIINGILDFSRIDAGRLQIESATFSLCELVEDVCSLLNEQAYEKHLELSCIIESNVPNHVIGDASKVRQVLLNIIGNAVKFTEVGEVSVYVEMVDDQAGSDQQAVLIRVRDTGIGMTAEMQERMFTAFNQGDSSMNRRYGGTGLGLAISKGLVEAMGGSLAVETSTNHGCTFTVALTFGKTSIEVELPKISLVNVSKVLCVDDNPSILRSLEMQLRRLGIHPVSISSAALALAAVREAASSMRPFDVVFLDNHLPQMLGMALVRSIKLIPSPKQPKCILLTNSSRIPQSAKYSEPITYLQKPFRFQHIRHCLETISGVTPIANQLIPDESGPVGPIESFIGKKILVAEDNPINQRLVSHILTKFGLVVDVVANGLEAVHASKLKCYDVILMDCQMPEMDGYEATRKIRQGHGGDVPIVALTANVLPTDCQRCLSAGMNYYLAKPMSQAALVDVLTLCLAREEASAFDTATPNSASAIPSSSRDVLLTVDRNVLTALSRSMPAGDTIVIDLIDIFKNDTPEQLRVVREAGEHSDSDTVARVAHRMKSGCRTLGFKVMEALCVDLERAGKACQMEGVLDSCIQLQKEYALVIEDLR
jgi:two-component system sensor histidine kinase/response regulator